MWFISAAYNTITKKNECLHDKHFEKRGSIPGLINNQDGRKIEEGKRDGIGRWM